MVEGRWIGIRRIENFFFTVERKALQAAEAVTVVVYNIIFHTYREA